MAGTHWLSERFEVVTRGYHKCAIGLLAYMDGVSAERPYIDQRTGLVHTGDTAKDAERVVHTSLLLPKGVSPAYRDAEHLINAAELHEDDWAARRYGEGAEKWLKHCGKSARVAIWGHMSFSRDLSLPEVIAAAKQVAEARFSSKGQACRVAVHADDSNFHSHFLAPARLLGVDGFGKFLTETNSISGLKRWQRETREACAYVQNRALALKGSEGWVEWRKFAHLNSPFAPTIHEGASATALSERGDGKTVSRFGEDRRRTNRRVAAENRSIIAADPLSVARHLICTTPSFTVDDLRREALRYGGGEVAGDAVQAILAHPDLIAVDGVVDGGDGVKRFTLASRATLNARILAEANALSERPISLPDPNSALPDSMSLAASTLLSGSSLAVALGDRSEAGRTALQEAVDVWTGQGGRVVGLSFAGDIGLDALGLRGVEREETVIGDSVHRLRWQMEEAERVSALLDADGFGGELGDDERVRAAKFVDWVGERKLCSGDLVMVSDLEQALPTDLSWLLSTVGKAKAAMVTVSDAQRLMVAERADLVRQVAGVATIVPLEPGQTLRSPATLDLDFVPASEHDTLANAVAGAVARLEFDGSDLDGTVAVTVDHALAAAVNAEVRKERLLAELPDVPALMTAFGPRQLVPGEPIVFSRDAIEPRVRMGEIGRVAGVIEILHGGEQDWLISVDFDDRSVSFRAGDHQDWDHAYAIPATLARDLPGHGVVAIGYADRDNAALAMALSRGDGGGVRLHTAPAEVVLDERKLEADRIVLAYVEARDRCLDLANNQANNQSNGQAKSEGALVVARTKAARAVDWSDKGHRDASRRNGVRRSELDLHAERVRALPGTAERVAADRLVRYARARDAAREQWRLIMQHSTPSKSKSDRGYPAFDYLRRERDRLAAEIAAQSTLHRHTARLMTSGAFLAEPEPMAVPRRRGRIGGAGEASPRVTPPEYRAVPTVRDRDEAEESVMVGVGINFAEVRRNAAEHRARADREAKIDSIAARLGAPARAIVEWSDEARTMPSVSKRHGGRVSVVTELERRASAILDEHEDVAIELAASGLIDLTAVYAWRDRFEAREDIRSLIPLVGQDTPSSVAERTNIASRLLSLDLIGIPVRRILADETAVAESRVSWSAVKRMADDMSRSDSDRTPAHAPTTALLEDLQRRIDGMLSRHILDDATEHEVSEAEAVASTLMRRMARDPKHLRQAEQAGLRDSIAWLSTGGARMGFGLSARQSGSELTLPPRARDMALGLLDDERKRAQRSRDIEPLPSRLIARRHASHATVIDALSGDDARQTREQSIAPTR